MRARNIGLDILRILLALMVIAIHFNAPATGHVAVSVTGIMKFFVYPMVALCYPAVNTYVLISGYFGYYKKKSISQILSSLIKLWFCLLFFSLFGYVLAVICGNDTFSISDLLKRFVPLSRGVWWYMTVYFVLMLISPYLNNLLDWLSKKEFFTTITIAILVCSIIPFFMKFESDLGLNYGSGLLWFIVLYLTGGGLCKYYLKERRNKYIWYAAACYILLTIYLLVSPVVHRVVGLDGYTSAMYNSIIVYGQAISLFVMFWHISIKNTSLTSCISFIAGLSLAAYIFHCQEDVGKLLWEFTTPYKYAGSWQLIPLFLEVVFSVFFIAILLELFRSKFFSINDIENRAIKRVLGKGIIVFDKVYNFLERERLI